VGLSKNEKMKRALSTNYYYCNKCSHFWAARLRHCPNICPKCKTTKWNDKGVKPYTGKKIVYL